MKTKTRTLNPLSQDELFSLFHEEAGSINKHLLTLYSLAVGLNAKRVVDLGAGSTTRVFRTALQKTGGELFTCDWDKEKWGPVQEENRDPNFHFTISDSKSFIQSLKGPFDLVLHDAAHDLWQVKWDLEHLWPMVRQFGMICVHDTQHSHLGEDMHAALTKAFKGCPVSWTHLPYQYGLTLIRIEKEQPFEPIATPWKKEGYEGVTKLHTYGLVRSDEKTGVKGKLSEMFKFLKWIVKRTFKINR